jgi:hypothetical protein
MPDKFPAIEEALGEVAASMTPDLQQAAIEGGWPEDVAQRMSVTYTKAGAFTTHFDGPQRTVDDLEFGTYKDPPKPVINNFIESHGFASESTRRLRRSMESVGKQIDGMFG